MTLSRRSLWLLSTVLFGAASLSTGCIAATGDSCEIKTHGISVTAEVKDDGTNVRAKAAFEAGDQSGVGTKLDLCDVDVFTINGNNPKRSEDGDSIDYSVSWPSADAPPTYDFKFDRTEDGDLVEWSVDLPPQFDLTGPAGGDISRAEELELTWEPDNPDGTINIELEDEVGEFCIATDMAGHDYMGVGGEDVADNGSRTIPVGAIGPHSDENVDDSCPATFTLMREQGGTYPSELKEGGSVTALVVRGVDFTSVP
jgi:hypothetical protein